MKPGRYAVWPSGLSKPNICYMIEVFDINNELYFRYVDKSELYSIKFVNFYDFQRLD